MKLTEKQEMIAGMEYMKALSIKLLERLGVDTPTDEQLDILESTLSFIGDLPDELTYHRLSQQELECFFWTIHGGDQYQIAKVMNIQRTTVKEYQNRIKRKFASNTISQATYKALSNLS